MNSAAFPTTTVFPLMAATTPAPAADSLLKTVWPDVAVEEGNLTKGVFSLRQILEGEDGPRYIETVLKRGYRFVGSVTTSHDDSVTVVSSAPAAATPSENSIAVMPFSDMSAARDHVRFLPP